MRSSLRLVASLMLSLAGVAAASPALAQQRGVAQQGPMVSTAQGALSASDPVDNQGHHVQQRSVQLEAGDQVRVSLASADFDTTLSVSGNGVSLFNDDASGQGTNSELSFRAPASGVYLLTVSSYSANETGSFTLSVLRGAGLGPQAQGGVAAMPGFAPAQPGCDGRSCRRPDDAQQSDDEGDDDRSDNRGDNRGDDQGQDDSQDPDDGAQQPQGPQNPAVQNASGGTVYGLFVGLSNQGNSPNGNLQYVADDARNLSGAFIQRGIMARENAVVLTDGRATLANVQRAFLTLGQRVTARDTFVFFFDGHGNTNELALYNGQDLTSRNLDAMLSRVRGHQLVVLDSCNSGGFQSIIDGHAERMGLFSSTAEEESEVASEVRAGGWLAYFMIQAVRGGLNAGPDGVVQLSELAGYARRGYQQRVDGQHLVVADGSRGTAQDLWASATRGNLAMADVHRGHRRARR